MSSWFPLNEAGIAAAIATALFLLHRYRLTSHARRFPLQGTAGAVILIGGQFLTLIGVAPVAIFFTPIAWTGYILWVDAAIFAIRGESPLRTYPLEFFWLAISSIPLWLIFEAYNLRLENWIYIGLPQNWAARQFGYAWAFSTIWPGVFETATLLRALGWNTPDAERTTERRSAENGTGRTALALLVTGAVLLLVPVILPKNIGPYLFGAVWLGFIFFLEPINLRLGRESLWRDFLWKDPSRLRALLWGGLICGVFWEFWNYWAAARWFYNVPIFPEWRIFAMPVVGYLGFPPFAVECFALFAFVAPWLGKLSALLGTTTTPDWRILHL